MFKSTNKLESVKSAFKQWRLTRPKQGKIPGYLWEQVNELLADYSLTKICSTLSITYNQIKDNIPSFEKSRMQFVEVTNSNTISTNVESKQLILDSCSIEVHRSSGEMLKINELPAHMVSQIICDFMG